MRKKCFLIALVAMLLPLMASAQTVEIDGIRYSLIAEDQSAQVVRKTGGYSGEISIPSTITYQGVNYSVTSIGGYAFKDCSGLTSITIPSSVTSIGNWVFEGCSGLTSVHISDLSAWCKIDHLYDLFNNAYHLYLNDEEIKDLVIPNDVKEINSYSFSGCSGLTSVTIPNSVTSIDGNAFRNCSGLTSIKVEEGTFYDSRDNCQAIINIKSNQLISGCKNTIIPESVTSIGVYAFRGCSGLTSVNIPDGVTYIDSGAFYGCTGLISVIVPNSVTSIGGIAFYGCSQLKEMYWLPDFIFDDEVFNIYDYIGQVYLGIKSKTILEDATLFIRSGHYSLDGVGSLFKTISYLDRTINGVNYEVTDYAKYAHVSGTDNSTRKIMIEPCVNILGKDYAVNSITSDAFKNNKKITSVSIPNSVTSIPDYAFYGCKSMESIEIGTNVNNIGERAFANIDKLTSVTCHSPDIPQTDRTAFENSYIDYVTLLVPEESVEDYKNTAPWNGFKTITGTSITTYTLTYIVDGEVYKTQTYEEGDIITPEPAPAKEGYVFSGWDNLPKVMPGKDVTVNGTFTEIPPEKCSVPTIAVIQGEIVFACETEDVVFHYDIKSLDEKTGEGNSVRVTNTYRVMVYTSKDGYDDSDTVTTDICIQEKDCDTNGDGTVNAADIVTVVNMIMSSKE